MLEQTVEVVRVEPGRIWVRPQDHSGCGSCGGQGCATRRLAELFRRGEASFLVTTDQKLSVGELVVVGLPRGSVLGAAMASYGLPLLGLFAGAVIGQRIGGESDALIGALAGLAVLMVFARRFPANLPRVLRSVGSKADGRPPVFPITKG